jgi:hypothetical protein
MNGTTEVVPLQSKFKLTPLPSTVMMSASTVAAGMATPARVSSERMATAA